MSKCPNNTVFAFLLVITRISLAVIGGRIVFVDNVPFLHAGVLLGGLVELVVFALPGFGFETPPRDFAPVVRVGVRTGQTRVVREAVPGVFRGNPWLLRRLLRHCMLISRVKDTGIICTRMDGFLLFDETVATPCVRRLDALD